MCVRSLKHMVVFCIRFRDSLEVHEINSIPNATERTGVHETKNKNSTLHF